LIAYPAATDANGGGSMIATAHTKVLFYVAVFAFIVSPAAAAGVTLADLDGTVIEATIVFENTGRPPGSNEPAQPSRWQSERKLAIGPGDTLRSETTDTLFVSMGTHVTTRSGSYTINKPREIRSSGGGTGVWLFSNGMLVFLRTLHSGAYKMQITFNRVSSGVACHFRAVFARENHVGDVDFSGSFGQPWEITSSRQISSTCRVIKR
jgi:hypothetical protein